MERNGFSWEPGKKIRKLIPQYLEENIDREFKLIDIQNYIKKNMPDMPVSKQMINGAFYSIANKPQSEIIKIHRDYYIFRSSRIVKKNATNSITPKIDKILGETVERIKNEANNIDILDIEPKALGEIQQLVKELLKLKQGLRK
ncbi:hypothetical protein [Domibacillus indicus]|uniref:hypothetical protein n=1 Tax=Domibacillus indicus TaxID=1437523 RepID=UPI000617BE68|nr:hypothetical protein [Domibacillus indicus]